MDGTESCTSHASRCAGASGFLGQDALVQQRLAEFPAGHQVRVDVDPDPEPLGSYGHDAVADQPMEPVLEVLPQAASPFLELTGVQQLYRRVTDRGRQRVAAEREAMTARSDDAEHVAARHRRGHRDDAATERLAQHVHVRDDVFQIAGESGSGAAETGLNLSMSTATVSASTAAVTASTSPYGTTRNPGVNGPKPSRATVSVEKLTIVVVRPWKLPAATMMFPWSAGTPYLLVPAISGRP
jgi:hypothetical protein